MRSRFHPAGADLAVVTLIGDLDATSAAQLRDHLGALLSDGADHLVLDFTHIGFVDSSGLSVLAGVHRLLQPSQRAQQEQQAGPDGHGADDSGTDGRGANGRGADGRGANGHGAGAGTVALAAVNQRVRQVLRITGLTRILPIYPSVQTAVVVLQAGPRRSSR
ncbi:MULTISPECIES: STAS domain-containing protein [Actinomadura]|uniref:STAS domain-containing protein n=1 Tax=Actinomadura yumaensis TaxID=111807 RepID=A0ABW2CKF8_9ACTN|nr:STAS domain-containing protein [Actinomadura sp. J1-007]